MQVSTCLVRNWKPDRLITVQRLFIVHLYKIQDLEGHTKETQRLNDTLHTTDWIFCNLRGGYLFKACMVIETKLKQAFHV